MGIEKKTGNKVGEERLVVSQIGMSQEARFHSLEGRTGRGEIKWEGTEENFKVNRERGRPAIVWGNEIGALAEGGVR